MASVDFEVDHGHPEVSPAADLDDLLEAMGYEAEVLSQSGENGAVALVARSASVGP